jgi:Flp pilus assembly protein TadG
MRLYSSSDLLSSGTAAHHRRAQRGASLVEYAFVVILFLSLLFGISGFGHALFVYHHLNNAAKEATRYATVRGYKCSNDSSCTAVNSASGIVGPTTADDVTAYVASITPQSIDSSKFTITVCGVQGSVSCAASGPLVCTTDLKDGSTPPVVIQVAAANYPGCTVSVQVQYAYNFVFPLIATTPINMSSTSEMIIVH